MVDPSLCLRCRGVKHLCGLPYCPLLVRAKALSTVGKVRASTEVNGFSPPSIYVSWVGYPKVSLGPSVPPGVRGDTSIYDLPEAWVVKGVEDVLSMRLSLVYGLKKHDVRDVWSYDVLKIQEIGLAERPVDVELVLRKPPVIRLEVSEEVPPMGSAGPLRAVKLVSNASFGRPVERVFYDTDLKAEEAVITLYRDGVPVSRIQKAMSVGALGVGRRRKLVPTRWSITAVDDAVSQWLIQRVKGLKELGEYLLYVMEKERNLFIAILIPGAWSFEWMEAWFPGSTWNRFGKEAVVENDWEGFKGRTTYPDIGGCYYASRLAVSEHLTNSLRRQATAILYREIYPGFNIPIGVWFVRESLRQMFREVKPERFSGLEEVKERLRGLTKVPVDVWWRKSHLLSMIPKRRSIYEFARSGERSG